MPTLKSYLADPHILAGEAMVLELIEANRRIIRLDRTYFHPQGGGQKGDRGFIGPVPVIDTKHAEEGEVDHFVETFDGLMIGQTYPIQIEASSRHTNAVYHSAGHLIAALVNPAFPDVRAVQGHHWPGEARVEFEGQMNDDTLARVSDFLPQALDKALNEQWKVVMLGDPFTQRCIQLGVAEQVPCGGTHVAHLGQIKNIVIKAVKKKGDRLRVHYDASVNELAFP